MKAASLLLSFVALGALFGVNYMQAQAPGAAKGAVAPGSKTEVAKAKPVGTMKEFMVDVLYPTSNDLFYIFREEKKTDADWAKVRLSALTLAESANTLMSEERRFDSDDWMTDAKLLLDVGRKAYVAAKAKDEKAIEDLNDELYTACVICHEQYRPNYGKRLLPGRDVPATEKSK